MRRYSIEEASQRLTEIVRELEEAELIELTRGGEPVAVLLSPAEHRRLATPRRGFSAAYAAVREELAAAAVDVGELLSDVRDRSPGRPVEL